MLEETFGIAVINVNEFFFGEEGKFVDTLSIVINEWKGRL